MVQFLRRVQGGGVTNSRQSKSDYKPSKSGNPYAELDNGAFESLAEKPAMIACPTVQKTEIQSHYDLATFFYRLLWGEHIHHGLWDAEETPEVAQRQLIDRQIAAAGIQPGARVLDVGCGMGA